ncbi:hypothetical protein ABES02_29110 [Neobacillus pocheonensis]|uniref:hypothetical protein n=1 Tax=Neobacillus pocheonensis TaxID=363869 RepID=UPI003D271D0D
MEWYRITERLYFDYVDVQIILGETFEAEETIKSMVAKSSVSNAILRDGSLTYSYNGNEVTIHENQRELYHFEVCKKKLPPPLSLKTIRESKDVDSLIWDPERMTTGDDYARVEWTLAETWWLLKSLSKDKNKEEFSFSSCSYGIQRKELQNGEEVWVNVVL